MPYKNIEDRKEYGKQYYKDHIKKIKGKNKQYRKDNFEKMKEYNKQWRKDNPEYMKEYYKQWQKDNPGKAKENSRQWRKNNPEKAKELIKQWHKDNSEKVREYRNKWMCLRYKTDLKFNLNNRMAIAIGLSLKGNKAGRTWELLTGYNLADLIRRLNKTIPQGYTWQDFLSGELHIDHKIPISAFNFTRPEHTDFKRCWALSNLRLLPAKENIIKSAKLDRPFQPALRI
ncbi:hypothetical protein ES705_42382 [subsurface metagenome]